MPRHDIPRAIVVLACAFVAVSACSDKPAKSPEKEAVIKLRSVHWKETGVDSVTLSEQTFLSLAAQALGKIDKAVTQSAVAMINGELAIEENKAALVLEARVEIEGLPFPLQTGVAATGSIAKDQTARALVERGLTDLALGIKGLFALLKADTAALMRALDSAEPDEQILALRLLGKAGARDAVPPIARLLSDPREQVSETAADVLVQIGDEKAVPLLIAGIRRGNLRSEVRAIEAMGRIGGKEAEAYLEMTALGHEVPEVRVLSQKLLEGLKRRGTQ